MANDAPVFRNSSAPEFIYFDGAPTFGVYGGAIQVELASRVLIPAGGNVDVEFVINAHLRCSPAAALELRSALEKALQMLAEPQAPTVAANQLN